ncbi:MAG TPA: hypothetical protein VF406_14370 [Thermodesulfobacteriota bacterium]
MAETFEKPAARTLPPTRAARLRDAALGLERLEDAAEVARLPVLD